MNVGQVTADANKQNTANAQQNWSFNHPNQQDMFGNTLTWGQNGTDASGQPIFTATQQLGALGQQYAGGLGALGQKYFDTAGQALPNSEDALDRAYQFATGNLEPRFERAREAERTRLINMGLDPRDVAHRAEMNDLNLQQNEARNHLVTQLQGQLFNQGLQGRQQQMAELQPGLSPAGAFMSGNYANNPTTQVQNVDVAGLNLAQQQQLQQQYQQQMAQKNAMWGGLAGIGGSLLMAPVTGGTSLGGMMMGGLGSLGKNMMA
jgi:hypothetical protein